MALAVLAALTTVAALDDGEQIVGIGRGMAVYDFLHLLFPAHVESLSGLVSAVGEDASGDVGRLEVGHVDISHASGVEGEEKEVAGKFFVARQVAELPDVLDVGKGDGAFPGLGNAGIDLGEGLLVGCVLVVDGPVVDGVQHAHIEGGGVAGQPIGFQVALVVDNQLLVDVGDGDVAVRQKGGEAVECAAVGLCSPSAPLANEFFHQSVDIVGE